MHKNFITLLPFLTLTAFSLVALQPLAHPAILCADDLQFHIHKAYALERLWQAGYFFPRWVPDMGRGFGYPLFNFYAPLSSYPLVLIHLAGFSYPVAINILFGLDIWLAGLGMFLFVRDLFGPWSGLAAAVAYMYAPYLAYDVYYRAALAEVTAWLWVPLTLWAIRRAMQQASWRWAVIGGVCYAALFPSHNLMAMLASPLIGGWVLVQALEKRAWKHLALGSAALLWGLALAAYFWVPAFFERNLVRTDRLVSSPVLHYANNFISIYELLAPPQTVDPLLINPSPPRGIGLVVALLVVPALLALARCRFRPHRWTVIYFTLGLLFYSWMTLPSSAVVWEQLPILHFVQFPWRMLGLAALCAAILIGAGLKGWEDIGFWGSGLVCLSLVLANLRWLHCTYCGSLPSVTLELERQLRRDTFQEGAYEYSEYLPRSIQTFPKDDQLYLAIVNGDAPDRLAASASQAKATLRSLSNDPLAARYVIEAPQTFEAVYQQFYYPGWEVAIDGQPTTIQVTPDTGLIRFSVPAGDHTVTIRFAETPLRASADLISAAALVAGGLTLMRFPRGALTPTKPAREPFNQRAWVGLSVSGVLLFGLKIGVIDQIPNPLRHTAFEAEGLQGTMPFRASFAGGVEIYGTDFNSPTLASDNWLDVTLFAGVRQPVAAPYILSLSVTDVAGLVWGTSNFPPWLRSPFVASSWPVGQYALWAQRIQVLPGTPPGRYHVQGTVFDLETLAPNSLIDAAGNAVAPHFDLGELTVQRPHHPASIPLLQMQKVSNLAVGNGLTLLGYTLDRGEARPGDQVLITLFWQADRAPLSNVMAELHLLDSQAKSVFAVQVSPVSDDFPASLWQAGDVWRGQHRLQLPASLLNGRYHWALQLIGEQATAPLGEISIIAPEHNFIIPDIEHPSDARWGNFAELVGYSISSQALRPGESFTVILIWKGLTTPAASYSGFIHVGNSEGRVWAQSDGIPQNWSRPTTGWLPGEYILDVRTLTLPLDMATGEFNLYVGLADTATGERAPSAGPGAQPDMRVLIGALRVEK